LEFHERLKELRKEKGFSQKELAELIGMALRNLQDIEYGKVDPRLSNVIKLADALCVSLDDLACYHPKNAL
jgi:transcriptional regulator with XRE-family HTH domain